METAGRGEKSAHILVVDDEAEIRGLIEEYLVDEGYVVTTAADGEAMRTALAQTAVDVVLLDLILPGEDGLELARSLRERSDAGIIILSGRGDTVDRIIGLEMGADDYLPKPFAIRELHARVRSVLRRVRARTEPRPAPAAARVRFAGWSLDLASRALRSPAGEEVRLTAGEFELLSVFVDNPNTVLSRDRLLYLTRGREAGPFDRAIDVLIGRLRRKLRDDDRAPHLIKGVRGIGYIFTPTVERPGDKPVTPVPDSR